MSLTDFAPLTESGVTQTEFASILGVSRVTVNRWIQGVEPTPYLARAIKQLLGDLQEAVDRGSLPGQLSELTPSRYTIEERRQVITAALQDVRPVYNDGA